jgi:protein-glucosylgalactosylhydroxylysine glucosidase
MSNLIYNNEWIMTLSNLGSNVDVSTYSGPFTGNGKIGLYGSLSNIGVNKTYVTGNLTFNQIGKYRNNMIEGYNLNTLKVLHDTNSNIGYNFQHQSLDMSSGSIETRFIVTSNDIDMVDVKHTVTPLRQFPFCVMQNVELKTLDEFDTLDIYHEMSGDANFISESVFNNNVIYNERIYDDKGLYMLNGIGNVNRTMEDGKQVKLAGAACYLFENSNIEVKNLGFNIYNNLSSCYQKHRYYSLSNDSTVRFNILSAQMTNVDFPDPMDEIKRMLMNIAFKNDNNTTLRTQITADNKLVWDNLWQSDIILEPKTGITTLEADDLSLSKRYIRHSLFNIYSCIREGINTEINPLNLSYLDTNGNIFFDGDLWLVPVLLLLKPSMAKTILEFRYRNLEQAMQLASSFGYKGSKFPYQNDVIGYQNMYWDVISPLHIFNNGLLAVNIWNYYRVTLDKEWLSTKGYAMMRNIADFLVSVVQIDENGNYNMNNLAGMSERISNNHAFTVYMSKLALKYIIEATYELNFVVKQIWVDTFLNLDVDVISAGDCAVIQYDDAYDGEDLDIMDQLIILNPYYSSIYFDPNLPCRDNQSIQDNIDYYSGRISTTYSTDPLNNLIFAGLHASVSQVDSDNMSTFYTQLLDTFYYNGNELWGQFSRIGPNSGNDVSLSALLILIILTSIGGLKIYGGVTESKFYYEEFGIRGIYFANMPNTWKNIRIKGVGQNKQLYNVVNNLFYP